MGTTVLAILALSALLLVLVSFFFVKVMSVCSFVLTFFVETYCGCSFVCLFVVLFSIYCLKLCLFVSLFVCLFFANMYCFFLFGKSLDNVF